MGYNQDKKIVLDETCAIGLRYLSLLHCVSQFTWLTHCGFRNELRHLYYTCGLKRGKPNSTDVIVDCISELDRQRNKFLKRLNSFERNRKIEKNDGKRTPPKKDLEKLFDVKEILIEKAIKS